jgi:hypothetical protein
METSANGDYCIAEMSITVEWKAHEIPPILETLAVKENDHCIGTLYVRHTGTYLKLMCVAQLVACLLRC